MVPTIIEPELGDPAIVQLPPTGEYHIDLTVPGVIIMTYPVPVPTVVVVGAVAQFWANTVTGSKNRKSARIYLINNFIGDWIRSGREMDQVHCTPVLLTLLGRGAKRLRERSNVKRNEGGGLYFGACIKMIGTSASSGPPLAELGCFGQRNCPGAIKLACNILFILS